VIGAVHFGRSIWEISAAKISSLNRTTATSILLEWCVIENGTGLRVAAVANLAAGSEAMVEHNWNKAKLFTLLTKAFERKPAAKDYFVMWKRPRMRYYLVFCETLQTNIRTKSGWQSTDRTNTTLDAKIRLM